MIVFILLLLAVCVGYGVGVQFERAALQERYADLTRREAALAAARARVLDACDQLERAAGHEWAEVPRREERALRIAPNSVITARIEENDAVALAERMTAAVTAKPATLDVSAHIEAIYQVGRRDPVGHVAVCGVTGERCDSVDTCVRLHRCRRL